MDHPHLFGPLHRRGIEPALPRQPGQGPDRPFGRLRPPDPDRLRPRPRTRQGRGRQGRRLHRPHRRHADAVRRHPARHHEHVHDHQRHGGVADGALRRGGRRAGRAAHIAHRHDPERHHQGVSVARHLRVPARALHAAHQGRDAVHDAARAEVEPDQRLLVPSAGGRRDAGAGAFLRAGDRNRRARHREGLRRGRRRDLRRRRRPHLVLRQRWAALHHRALQDARLHRAVGRVCRDRYGVPIPRSGCSATACR